MPKYSLSAQITVSAFCEIEADSMEEAIEKSHSMSAVIHAYNTGTSPQESWCVEEIDGEPVEISAEEILG
jgi:hypothetical protein